MIRIIDGRGTGKTSRLMLLAKENNALFVCANPNAMKAKAMAYGITGIRFVSFEDFLRLNYDEKETKVVIDEVEGLVNEVITPLNLVGYTLSNND